MKQEKTFNLLNMQKKGQAKIEGKIEYLIGGVIVVAMLAALAPQIFLDLDTLTTATGVPSWVPTVLIIVAGAGLVFLVWRALMGRK